VANVPARVAKHGERRRNLLEAAAWRPPALQPFPYVYHPRACRAGGTRRYFRWDAERSNLTKTAPKIGRRRRPAANRCLRKKPAPRT